MRYTLTAIAVVMCLAGCRAPPPPQSVIVSAPWLATQQLALGPRLTIVEASWAQESKAAQYLAGHIPAAIHLDTDDLENGYPRWHLRPLPELHQVIGRLGITPTSTVVVYGKDTLAAARAWWVLHYAGVRDVRFLNGGLDAWTREGFPVETEPRTPTEATFTATPREDVLATTPYVHAAVLDKTAVIADTRSLAEFEGKISGYSYLEARGRIPGAVFAADASDSAHIYQEPDGTLKPLDEIRRLWQQSGLLDSSGRTAAPEIVFSCGSGWRSSLAFLYAHAMGFSNIRNYSDGWSGWSTAYRADPADQGMTPGWRQSPSGNPIQTGPSPASRKSE